MENNTNHYNAEDIVILKGLEPVRKRPGMYIGSTGPSGLHHLVYEIVDNSIDEAQMGECDHIIVTLHSDNSVTVIDNGRGIPVDIKPEVGKSALEVVLTVLHAGGKFGSGGYKVSGGLHGVGLSVVNALSEYLYAKVYKDGKVYFQEYSRGVPKSKIKIIGETDRRGTEIHFKPDHLIFKSTDFDGDTIALRLRELAFLNKGVRIDFVDEKNEENYSFKYDGGIKEFVAYINKSRNRTPLHSEPIYIEGEKDNIKVEISLQSTIKDDDIIYSYANSINTSEGGYHLSAFKVTLTKIVNDMAKMITKNPIRLQGSDIREGLTAIISVKIPEPEFEGQTKEKLGNQEVYEVVSTLMKIHLTEYFELNKDILKVIYEKAVNAAKAREAAKRARELIKRKNALESSSLPGKLADCSTKDKTKAEIFIVEGDSAGGSAKQGRDREFQAILPLRGKILNVEKNNLHKLLKSEQITNIISALGCGIKEDYKEENLRYNKVIIMTDADVDGEHIRTLLLTLFYRYIKDLIQNGHVYIAVPPLYRLKFGRNFKYLYSDEELDEEVAKLKKEGKKFDIQRYKGLGEMNPDQLWETTMHPEKRKMLKVSIENDNIAGDTFEMLMGDDVEKRRIFIKKHATKATNIDF